MWVEISKLTDLEFDNQSAYQLVTYSNQLLQRLRVRQIQLEDRPCSTILQFIQSQPYSQLTFILRCGGLVNPIFKKVRAVYASDEQIHLLLKENELKRIRDDEICLNILSSLRRCVSNKNISGATLNEMIDIFSPGNQLRGPTTTAVSLHSQHTPYVKFRGCSFLGVMCDIFNQQFSTIQEVTNQAEQIVDLLQTQSVKEFVVNSHAPICDCKIPTISFVSTRTTDKLKKLILGESQANYIEMARIVCMLRSWFVENVRGSQETMTLFELATGFDNNTVKDEFSIDALFEDVEKQNKQLSLTHDDQYDVIVDFATEEQQLSEPQVKSEESVQEIISKQALATLIDLLQKKDNTIQQLVRENARLLTENQQLRKNLQLGFK